ncbi:MAG: hypothetical protein II723_06260 [Oscillospiraceae bacterium]|nr:hypothetical protein [Oscillospiraceae bacterium]
MEAKQQTPSPRSAAERVLLLLAGSLFVQIFCWAVYDHLKLTVWFCGLSAVVTAVLYHFVQRDQGAAGSPKTVFFAAILLPLLLSAALTVTLLLRHRELSLLGAAADGVSPLTELTALYSARLLVNGIPLLIFAAADAVVRRRHPAKERVRHEEKAE